MMKMAMYEYIIFLILVFLYPAVGLDFNSLWQSVNNIISIKVGGLKFLSDMEKFEKTELKDITPANWEEFDFIVIGAGSSGSVVASRLSEESSSRVLLIEAGGHESLALDIPLPSFFLLYDEKIHWNMFNDPSNSSCLGMKNRRCKFPFGKVMGGGSTINAMIATRGSKEDYDGWARITGDDSWSYESMLKYFKKLEAFGGAADSEYKRYHNSDGPVRINDVMYRTKYVDSWVKAGAELGLPPVDYNGRRLTGLNYLQTNQINGERLSSNRAYLHPIKGRRNLVVSMFSHVTKILIDPQTMTAYGVEFIKRGRKITVRATKEIISSAGAVGSPKILMLSGIGPRQHLEDLGVQVLVDAPVGENLMDHVAFINLQFLTNVTGGIQMRQFLRPVDTSLSDYFSKRKGPLTVPSGAEGIGYINVDDPSAENQDPNIELTFGSILPNRYIYEVLGFNKTYYKKSLQNFDFDQGYFIWPVLVQPKSRGKVLLRDADPMSKPKIYGNYLSHPEDVRIGVEGIKFALKISQTNAMKQIGSKLHHEVVLGCEGPEFMSDEYWACALRAFMLGMYHHSGTCKMGREDDHFAVVDTRLRVKGVKGLRVADTSIIPVIPIAHLMVPAMAVGDKVADMIKCDWGLRSSIAGIC